MVDLICNLKIRYCTFFGRLFGWILQGPIENHKFEVEISVELSEDNNEVFTTAFDFFECDKEMYRGDYVWSSLDLTERKYSRKKPYKLDSSGKYEMRLFFDSKIDYQITSKEGTIQTNSENKDGYAVIPRGARYFFEPLTVHPILEVFLLIFAVISGIGALFEVRSFFLKS